MIYLYYSDSKEKDLVESWAKYGTKIGFATYTGGISDLVTVSTDCGSGWQCCTSTDTCAKNTSYDTICTTSNIGKLTVDYSNTTVTQGTTSSNYPWNYAKSNSWDYVTSNYITNPTQLEAEHRKVKQIIKFKPI